MLPSGAMVMDDEESSSTRAAGCVFCAGSKPGVAPRRQPPGVPLAGSSVPGKVPWSLLQPSFSRSRMEAHHMGVRSGLAAAIPAYRLIPTSRRDRVTVDMVPSGAMAGAAFNDGRIVPQGTVGGSADGLGGQGSWLFAKTVRHGSLGPGDGRLPGAVSATRTE